MPIFNEIPFDKGLNPRGYFEPVACILHRTYGSYGGDYSVGKGTGSPGKGFHFYCPKTKSPVQFYETNIKCNHARGANAWALGIEFEGINENFLTDNQLYWGSKIIKFISEANKIPLDLKLGARFGKAPGFRGHAQVSGSDHEDYVTRGDWDRMLSFHKEVKVQRNKMFARVPGLDQAFSVVYPNGSVHCFNGAPFFGSANGVKLNKPIVGMAWRSQRDGYWLLAEDGGVFTYGNAQYVPGTYETLQESIRNGFTVTGIDEMEGSFGYQVYVTLNNLPDGHASHGGINYFRT